MRKKIFWMVGIPIIALSSLAIGITSNNDDEKYFTFEEKVVPPGETHTFSFPSVDLRIVAKSDFYECGRYSIIKKNLVQESGSIKLEEKKVLVEEKYSLFLQCDGPKVVIRQK